MDSFYHTFKKMGCTVCPAKTQHSVAFQVYGVTSQDKPANQFWSSEDKVSVLLHQHATEHMCHLKHIAII